MSAKEKKEDGGAQTKRSRATFTNVQLEELERMFSHQR